MEIKTLQTSIKKDFGSLVSKRHRKSGQIPAVLYGHKQECIMLLLDKKEFSRAFDSGVKMVALKWNSTEEKALIKEVQYDTFGNEILHVDFIRVDLTEKITTQVPIVLYGNSPGVKEGAILGHTMKETEIECLPTEIPENIRVDISGLNVGDAIHVKDLELASNIKVLGSPDATIVSVHFAAEEKETSDEESAAEPEVLTARKPEEGKEAENKG